MKGLLCTVFVLNTVVVFGARAAPCLPQLSTSPVLRKFYATLEVLRGDHPALRFKLHDFIRKSDFSKPIDPAAQDRFARLLVADGRAKVPARELLARALKPGRGGLRRLNDLEIEFEARRVVDLRLIPELLDDVLSGLKTSSIRAGNVFEIKAGPGVFRLENTAVRVPVEITSVRFGEGLATVSIDDVRAQGPFVRGILDTQGLDAAVAAIRDGMRESYPGFGGDQDVTVVHFKLRAN